VFLKLVIVEKLFIFAICFHVLINYDASVYGTIHWKNLLETCLIPPSPPPYSSCETQGTSRSSILGEVDVNLAEFAEALKPASIALPLRGCDFGTLLHV
jgi:hypothetical protein